MPPLVARITNSLCFGLLMFGPVIAYAIFGTSPLARIGWFLPIVALLILWRYNTGARRIRRQRAVLDLTCPDCGYDVAEQFRRQVNRCPECGAALDYARFQP